MMEAETDEDRGARILKSALERVSQSLIPVEIIMLVMLLYDGLDPKDAVATAYLIGKESK